MSSEKMEKLAERYPPNKFVWITPKVDTAGAMPEHLDYSMSTIKFSPNPDDGYVYPMAEGKLALTKSALMSIASAAGIKWIPNLNRRIDDGSDKDIVEWQATGILAGLSGMTPVTCTKRVDLALLRYRDEMKYKGQGNSEKYIEKKVQDNDIQRREFVTEMAETKAQLRVVRAILGIPGSFTRSTIEKKEFAILRISFSPKPRTARERELVLGQMASTYLGAYPGAEPQQIGAAEEHPQLGAGEDPEEAPEDLQEAEVVPEEEGEDYPDPEEAPEEDGEPETTDNYDFLKTMAGLKKQLKELLGEEEGAMEYYKPIYDLGVKKSNQIIDHKDQEKVYRTLQKRVKSLRQNIKKKDTGKGKKKTSGTDSDKSAGNPSNPQNHPEGSSVPEGIPDGIKPWLYDFIRKNKESMSIEELTESIEELVKNYDVHKDPLGILGDLNTYANGNRERLIELAVRLQCHLTLESGRDRDKRNRERRGA